MLGFGGELLVLSHHDAVWLRGGELGGGGQVGAVVLAESGQAVAGGELAPAATGAGAAHGARVSEQRDHLDVEVGVKQQRGRLPHPQPHSLHRNIQSTLTNAN